MTTIDKTGASDEEFERRIAPFEADVEIVARALWESDPDVKASGQWPQVPYDAETYRPMAAAAIAAMPPSPAEEAVKRVEALVATYDRRPPGYGSRFAVPSGELRAALASPAPAPQETWCNLPICPEGDGDHRITTGRCIVAPAPQETYTYQTNLEPAPHDRYAQCDDTCTVDCGACKGSGPR